MPFLKLIKPKIEPEIKPPEITSEAENADNNGNINAPEAVRVPERINGDSVSSPGSDSGSIYSVHSESILERKEDSDSESESESKSDSESRTESISKRDSDSESDSKQESTSDSKSETDSDSESNTESDSKPASESIPEQDLYPESNTQELQPDSASSDNEHGQDSESDSESKSDSDFESGSEEQTVSEIPEGLSDNEQEPDIQHDEQDNQDSVSLVTPPEILEVSLSNDQEPEIQLDDQDNDNNEDSVTLITTPESPELPEILTTPEPETDSEPENKDKSEDKKDDEEFKLQYDFTSGKRYVDLVSTKTDFDRMLDELANISKELLEDQADRFARKYTSKFKGDNGESESESDARKYEAFLGGYISNAALLLYDKGYGDEALRQLDKVKITLETKKRLEEETAAIHSRVEENNDVVDLSDILGLFGDG